MRLISPIDIRSQVSPKGTNSSRENSNSMTAKLFDIDKSEAGKKLQLNKMFYFFPL
jgi:hypothetical protein